MSVYTFINGVRKRAFTYNPRVKVNGAIKKIVKAYTFISGVRHDIFSDWSFVNEQLYLNDAKLTLPAGTYQFIIRGGGGAGGTYWVNDDGSWGHTDGAGAGGKGDLVVQTITKSETFDVNLFIGCKGRTYNNGGNGGYPGYVSETGAYGGHGGGGAKPSYIILDPESASASTYYACGGGGGGGHGGSARHGRYGDAGSGGGGGGYYRVTGNIISAKTTNRKLTIYMYQESGVYYLTETKNGDPIDWWEISGSQDMENYNDWGMNRKYMLKPTGTITTSITLYAHTENAPDTQVASITLSDIIETKKILEVVSVPGQTGGRSGGDNDGNGYAGIEGNTTDFPDIYSGAGGRGGYSDGWRGYGGAKAFGGGASGAGGGAGAGNHSSSFGGGGGGGAGGSLDAGGGIGGSGKRYGEDAYNYHLYPTDTMEENMSYGINSNYGIGGGTNKDGSQGFIMVKRIA